MSQILGSHFGHEYIEDNKLPDISKFMPDYRYLPHNSVLWLWTLGGLVGFTFLWWYLAAMVYLAARAYRFAHVKRDRALMLISMCAVVAYTNQAFGDMGTQSYT